MDQKTMKTKMLSEGSFLGLYARGHWEYASRTNCSGAVGILPITDDQELILVEQFRIPLQARVIEIPAGLAGDEDAFLNETLAETAARELLEETGYRAGKITPLISSPTSPGMTTEMVSFFAATELTREHGGGGTQQEDILVHVYVFSNRPKPSSSLKCLLFLSTGTPPTTSYTPPSKAGIPSCSTIIPTSSST